MCLPLPSWWRKARIAGAEKKNDKAIALLTEAVAKEDQLAYDEPADGSFPCDIFWARRCCGRAGPRTPKRSIARICSGTGRMDGRCTGWRSHYGTEAGRRGPGVQQRFDGLEDADIALTASAF